MTDRTPPRLPRRGALLLLAALAAAPGAALAQPPRPQAAPPAAAELSTADRALADRAAAYLQGLSAARGRFTQTDFRGRTTTGTLSLQRPGKARFAYDGQGALLVVADGNNVSVWDPRLKTFDRYPLGLTPLSLLLARQVRLDQGVRITRVARRSDGFAITARDARRQAEGQITLDFLEAPLRLAGWTVTDGQGRTTRVQLQGLQPASGLDPALFVLRDPRPRSGRP